LVIDIALAHAKSEEVGMKTVIVFVMTALVLTLVACGGKVDEVASGTAIGMIEESSLGSGESANATFDLSPGKYVLICNLSGHYKDGMYAGFTVTAGDAPNNATVAVDLGEYLVRPDSASLGTGPVTFKVTNKGDSDHNFVVIKSDLAPAALVMN
jgi:uncharacterized cupredoxin-like copper-binding protein